MNINGTEYITVTDHLHDIAELKKQQPSLNVEKAAEEIFAFVNKGDDYFRQDIANIIRNRFTKAQPSQPTDEQICGIAFKYSNQMPAQSNFDVSHEWHKKCEAIIKQAILSTLALRK